MFTQFVVIFAVICFTLKPKAVIATILENYFGKNAKNISTSFQKPTELEHLEKQEVSFRFELQALETEQDHSDITQLAKLRRMISLGKTPKAEAKVTPIQGQGQKAEVPCHDGQGLVLNALSGQSSQAVENLRQRKNFLLKNQQLRGLN